MDTSVREVTTSATLDEKKKLRKEFKVFDMIFITIAAIIGLDTIGAVSANGGQALTWLLISAVTFFLPYGLLIAELGTTFPQEGGVYEWCKMAGGRYFAALGSMLYWISNPLWIGGTLSITAIGAISIFFFGNINYQVGGSRRDQCHFQNRGCPHLHLGSNLVSYPIPACREMALSLGYVCQIRAYRALRGACDMVLCWRTLPQAST